MIEEEPSLLHWNYFLALEADIERLARYVEFTKDNFETFSIEIAHIFLASTSEVDVVAKQLCKGFENDSRASSINKYRETIKPKLPELPGLTVSLPRYGLTLTPWDNWNCDKTPEWWMDCNKVKHNRDTNFRRAHLKNVLNSMAGLFMLNLFLYKEIKKMQRIDQLPNIFMPPDQVAFIASEMEGPAHLYLKENPNYTPPTKPISHIKKG